jgi:hypothetical protein
LFFAFDILYVLVFTRNRAFKLSAFQYSDFLPSQKLIVLSQALMVITFISWVFLTGGSVIFDPRAAYMNLRKGIGFIWAFGIYTVSLNASLKLLSNKLSLRSVLVSLLLPYFYASKGFIISITLPFIFYKGPNTLQSSFQNSTLRRYFQKFPFLPFLCFSSILLFILYKINSGFSNEIYDPLQRIISTYSSFGIANNALLEKSKDFVDIKNSIYYSSFWSLIPRLIYPDKPFAYGSASIIEYFYPGLPEAGATPSVGLGLIEYLQFGYFGLVPNILLNFQLMLPIIFIICLIYTPKDSYKRFKLFSFCCLLVAGGLTFHIPPVISFIFSMFVFRIKF